MKMLALSFCFIVSLFSNTNLQAQDVDGITYTHFTPVFEENQDLEKTSPVHIYSGVIDNDNAKDHEAFIQDIIIKEQKLYGKDNVQINFYLGKDKNSNEYDNYIDGFKERFTKPEIKILDYQNDYTDPSYQLFPNSSNRDPSSVFGSGKVFWVITKFVSLTGVSSLAFWLDPNITFSTFHLFKASLIAATSSAVTYYSDPFGQWLESGKQKKLLTKGYNELKAFSKKSYTFFNTIANRVRSLNPVLAMDFELRAKALKEIALESVDIKNSKAYQKSNQYLSAVKKYIAKEGESLGKWIWTEFLFVQFIVEGPRLIKDMVNNSIEMVPGISKILESSIRSLKGAGAGMLIQMLPDVAIYKNRNLDVKKAYLRVEQGLMEIDDKEKFLKQAKWYLDSIDVPKDATGNTISGFKKYVYVKKEAHPLMQKIYRKFYARNVGLSLLSVFGAILTTLESPIASYYVLSSSIGGAAYYINVAKSVKNLSKNLENKNSSIVKKNIIKSFLDRANYKYRDAIRNICNENMTKFK